MNIAVSLHTFKYCAIGKHIRYSVCAINSKYLKNVLINERRPYSDFVERKSQNGVVFRPISKCVITNRYVHSSARKSVFDVDTNVKTDVVLYKNDSWYYTCLGYLAALQLAVWIYFAYHFVKFIKFLPEGEVYIFGIVPLHEKRWQIAIPSTFVCAGNYSIN